ncbi:MAG TPA: hypothetical protein VF212_18040 [Longimicrobiales bacterium]
MQPLRAPPPIPPLLYAALCLLPSCGRSGQEEFVQAAEQRAIETPAPPREARDGEPPEIYYDLTRYDWYRRGRPLVAAGRPYQPSGRPEPTGAREFVPLGRFQGVAYYTPDGATPPHAVLYVPVAPGYWQPFGLVAAPGPSEPAPAGDAPP